MTRHVLNSDRPPRQREPRHGVGAPSRSGHAVRLQQRNCVQRRQHLGNGAARGAHRPPRIRIGEAARHRGEKSFRRATAAGASQGARRFRRRAHNATAAAQTRWRASCGLRTPYGTRATAPKAAHAPRQVQYTPGETEVPTSGHLSGHFRATPTGCLQWLKWTQLVVPLGALAACFKCVHLSRSGEALESARSLVRCLDKVPREQGRHGSAHQPASGELRACRGCMVPEATQMPYTC